MKRLLPLALAAGVVAAAALTANLLLVGYASNRDDPVGKLSPRAALTSGSTTERQTTTGRDEPFPTTTAEPEPTPSTTTTEDDDGDDGGRGRGRNRGRGGDGSSDDD